MSDVSILRCIPPGEDLTEPKQWELSDLDSTKLPVLFPIYLIFSMDDSDESSRRQLVDVFKTALEKTLSQYPLMLGQVFVGKDTHRPYVLRSKPEDGDILFTTGLASPRHDLPTYQELEERHFLPSCFDPTKLFPRPELRTATADEGGPPCLLQLSFIRNGLIVSCIFNHVLNDAASYEMFLQTWASHCNPRISCPCPPLLDRTILNSAKDISKSELQDLEAYVSLTGAAHLGLWPPQFPARPPKLSTAFATSPNQTVKAFKDEVRSGTDAPISSSDCLIALLWRGITRSRLPLYDLAATSNQTTALELAVNFRNRRNSFFPADYFGNAMGTTSAHLPVSSLLAPDATATAAESIRASIEAIDEKAVEKLVDWAANMSREPRRVAAGPQLPNINLLVTSWSFIDCYRKLDFGFGLCKAWSVGTPPVECVIILPARRGQSGAWEALVNLEEGCLKRLLADAELMERMTLKIVREDD